MRRHSLNYFDELTFPVGVKAIAKKSLEKKRAIAPSVLHIQVDVEIDAEYLALALVRVRLGFLQNFYQPFLVHCVQEIEVGFQVLVGS